MTLEEMIKRSGKTQREVAKECDITEVTMSRYVHYDRVPSVYMALRIANSLGCTVDDIWGSGQSASPATFDGLKEYCFKCADESKKIADTWNDRIGHGDSEISAIGALAWFMKQEQMYRWEIPSVIDAYLSEKEGVYDNS